MLNKMSFMSKRVWLTSLSFYVFLSLFGVAHGATTIEYAATCKYSDKNNRVKYQGPCQANFGVGGMTSKFSARYIITFPNKSELVIYVYENDLAIINDVPAKILTSPPKTLRFVTGEREEFQFTTPPPGSS